MVTLETAAQLLLRRHSHAGGDVLDYLIAAPLREDWRTSAGMDMTHGTATFKALKDRECVSFSSGANASIVTGLGNETEFTVCVWVTNDGSSAGARSFASVGNGGRTTTLSLERNTSSVLIALWHNAYAKPGNTQLGLADWHHIAVTRDGTMLGIYLDGVATNLSESTWLETTSAATLYLNSNGTYTSQSTTNAYHDLRLYTRALSPAEIRRVFLATK